MKKKLLLGLLVVLMVGILAFSVFACSPKDDGKDKKPADKDPGTTPPAEETVTVKAGDMFNDLFASLDKTVATVNDIEVEFDDDGNVTAGAASVNADLYVQVKAGEANYDVKLNISGSVDAGNNAKNWALVSADILGIQVGLFAEKASSGNEYLYLGQNILNEEFAWSKLSQAEEADLLGGKAVPELLKLVASLEDAEFSADGMFKGADVSETIDAGLVSKIDIIGTIKSAVGLVGKLLFKPIDGLNTIEDGETNLSSANGYAAALNIEELSGVISGVMPMLSGLIGDADLTPYQPIVDMVVPMLLGGNLNLSNFTFTPIEGAIPDIRLLVDINEDKSFGGLHLSYETADKSTFVAFGLDNISFKATSASKPSAVADGIEDAEELAINLGLDIELDTLVGGYAEFDLNVYPNVSILGFGEDGYLDIDFSNLYAEVVMTYPDTVWDIELNEEVTEEVSTVIAQYNADGNEDIVFDLYAIASRLDGCWSGRTYVVPVNLQAKYDAWASPQVAELANAGEEAGLVDTIIGIVGGILESEGELDIVGLIMNVAGQLGAIVEEVSELAVYLDAETGTLNVEDLIKGLIAEDGLIGESELAKFGLYTGEGNEKMDWTLAAIMDEGVVLDNIAKLVNSIVYENSGLDITYGEWEDAAGENLVTTADIIALVANVTGATLDTEDAYANMSISATGYAQDGIGAEITAVLGGDDATAEIVIGINAGLIDNVDTYEVAVEAWPTELITIGNNGEIITLSNNTGDDGAKLLVNDLKKIVNEFLKVEKFAIATFETYYAEVIDDITAMNTISSYVTYAFTDAGAGANFIIEAEAGSTIIIEGGVGAVSVALFSGPVPGMAQLFAENEGSVSFVVPEDAAGIRINVAGTAGQAVLFSYSVEAPAVEVVTYEIVAGENTTPEFVAGSMADPGISEYTYTYTATEACNLTITFDDTATWMGLIDEYGSEAIESGAVYALEAGETISFAVANAAWGTDAVTFTATIA